ncbi:MAG: hypothetical protein JXA19_01905 [Anaerolineales bacterium]|nr:hypothetical protein [Anaerolineales bacterium]
MANQVIKHVLGKIPRLAEFDWRIRQKGKAIRGFSLGHLENNTLLNWTVSAENSPYLKNEGKKVFLFGTQRYWIEHAALLGITLAGLGHKVTLAYLPYANWQKPVLIFDRIKHDLYAREILAQAEPLITPISFWQVSLDEPLPDEIKEILPHLAERDVQYTLEQEEIDKSSDLYALRLKRDTHAAEATYNYLKHNRPDVAIIPNGMILEFGAVYEVARYLDIPVTTYEFGEQRERIWLSQDKPVMLQDTDSLWRAFRELPFGKEEKEQIQELYAARRGGGLYQQFYRKWQNQPQEGAQQAREKLGLNDRPVVVLASNVLGDSLTLDRHIFTGSMAEWVRRTVKYFAEREDVQFIIRTHPGETLMRAGVAMADVVSEVLSEIPENIHLVLPEDKVNTYDIIAFADLGLTYTTTVGMEIAMCGVPVVVVGNTHYRGRGFTYDPASWEEYFLMLDEILENVSKAKLRDDQIEIAWHYAHRFYFNYPQPFPWHLVHFWDDLKEWRLEKVFSPEGMQQFGKTFRIFVGEPMFENQTEVQLEGILLNG